MLFPVCHGIIWILNLSFEIESGLSALIFSIGIGRGCACMQVKPIAEILSFLEPVANKVGVEIIDAKWDMRVKSLTLFIDAPGGVDLNLCEKFHRAVDAPLDELDPTYGAAYTLNCSSPGLDRPFTTAHDYERHMGEKIEVHLYAPIDKKKLYEGELKAYNGSEVTILTETGEKTFPIEKCAKVCLWIEL